MRAALYARVSSEEQVEGYSIDAQRRAFHTLVEAREWTAGPEYVDEGKSARSEDIGKRPMFKEMIADASTGTFDVLVVHKLDRFSRNLRTTLEYFDKLMGSGVAFVSIGEQMDFTTPSGKVHLALLGAFAQYYSDNLSQETKKGWHERRKQGLYCGRLPFGAAKGEEGVPVPDMEERQVGAGGRETIVRNWEGLRLAYELSSQGKSDREVAAGLNVAGYRTTGTHGPRPFSRDTVKDMLVNRFYLGYIPDGNGGWLPAKHEPLIDSSLFEAVQLMRQKNRTSTHKHSSPGRTTYSLTGLAYCWYCGQKGQEGRMHVACVKGGKPRLGCYNRAKGWDCPQTSAFLEIHEQQIRAYLQMFTIPEDYQERIVALHTTLQGNYDADGELEQLRSALRRLKELYKWGDIDRAEYQREREQIQSQLARLAPFQSTSENLGKLAGFLSSVVSGWDAASHEQRNRLARCLFQEVWIQDKSVVAVKPEPESEPFFRLNWEDFAKRMKSEPRSPSGSPVVGIMLATGLANE